MADLAWATSVVDVNYQAIISEAAGSFDRAFLESWVSENGEGYFIRDTSSPLDCCLFAAREFSQLYNFRYPNDTAALFREVEKIG